MAPNITKTKLWLFALACVFTSHVLLAFPSTSSNQMKGNFISLHRDRRQTCADGSYQHEGQTCCQCGAGYYVEHHCSLSQRETQCQPCPHGQYSSHANSQKECEICKTCDPNGNLEENKSCDVVSDTKCQCKKGYYSTGSWEEPTVCNPCKECGDEGVKEACTLVSNTVCNEITNGGNGGKVAGAVVGVLLILAIAAVLLYYFLIRKRQTIPVNSEENDKTPEEDLPLLKDIHRHLPAIAEELGWVDAQDVAISSGMTKTEVDECKMNYVPEERTLQLLLKWHEKEGQNGSQRLITILRRSKKGKAEKVMDILRKNDNE